MLLKGRPARCSGALLVRSEEFFRAYLELCEDRLGRMRGAVAQADRTMELLDNAQLE